MKRKILIVIVFLLIVTYGIIAFNRKQNIYNDLIVNNKKTNIQFIARSNINDYRYAKEGFIADGGTQNVSCGQAVYINYCDDTYCYFPDPSNSSKTRKGYRSKLATDQSAAKATCVTRSNDNTYTSIYANRYAMAGFIEDGSIQCGQMIYIEKCDKLSCEYTDPNTNGKKYGARSRLAVSYEAAISSCINKINANRYASDNGSGYSCGDELYITTCSDNTCEFSKVNGKAMSGVVSKTTLKTSETVAKKNCGLPEDIGRRFISEDGDNYACGDELYITKCDTTYCNYTEVNKIAEQGVVERNKLKEDKNAVTCPQTDVEEVNGYLYSTKMGNNTCGNKLHITTCDESICNYDSVNGEIESGIIEKEYLITDKLTAYYSCDGQETIGYMYPSVSGEGYACGQPIYIVSCSLESCGYSVLLEQENENVISDGKINIDLLLKDQSAAIEVCNSESVDYNQNKCDNKSYKNQQGENAINFCYEENDTLDEIKSKIKSNYICDTKNGYYFDETAVVAQGEKICNGKGICTRTYSVNCTRGKEANPSLAITSGTVQPDGYGTITGKVQINEGTITSVFMSEKYETPTNDSTGWQKLTDDTFTIRTTPGIKYFWVKDSKGNISDGVGGAVLDGANESTTVHELKLYDMNGNLQNSDIVSYEHPTLNSQKYVMLSNTLSKDSKVLADGFNPFEMQYKISVSSPALAVYATLTSKDAYYVPGYEPRTVNLKYGLNTILIKIKNKEGKERTYTILATRTDDRTSDNTLSEIKLSEGKIEFNANVTDYKIEINNNVNTVNVDAKIGSDKASYIQGYEPGVVEITGDTTIKLIKVQSETGTTRTYVLTFIKKGKDVIKDASLQLYDLAIPGVNIAFEPEIANYSLSVTFETNTIDLNAVLSDPTSSMLIKVKRKNDNQYNKTTKNGISLDVGENFIEVEITNKSNEKSYYRFTIIRKEFGLDISSDTSLKDLKVLGYNIKFAPNKKDYVVKIKQEKSLVITAVPESNRAEVFIRGNEELTGFSTVRIKVIAENGNYETYSIDIKKDIVNKTIELIGIVTAASVIIVGSIFIAVKNKSKKNKEYYSE